MRLRSGAGLLFLLLVAGCALAPAERRTAPRLTPSEDIAPGFALPDARARMVHLARQEWLLFGSPVVREEEGARARLEFPPGSEATHEVQGPMLARVLTYWYAVSDQPIVGYQGELRPWSAAFISWLVRSAGIPEAAFPSTVLHWDYIERALSAGEAAGFVARDARAHAPRVGDLICAPRGERFVAEVQLFADLRRGAYHCDLVVALRPGELDAIGGNVHDAVSLTRVARDAQGRVLPSATRPWIAVIEQR